jgi:hypothetical protein
MGRSLKPGTAYTLAILAMLAFTAPGAAAQCVAESGPRRVALLELYTSEGCDSCPPADRWVSALAGRTLAPERVVTLGFHVDYWNYLGWNDPFARPEYSARQRAANQRSKARVVYTPQLLLNGADYRRGALRDDFADRLGAVNRSEPGARISLKLSAQPQGTLAVLGKAVVADAAQRSATRAWLALYENNLSTEVKAGENRGKRLRHDYVVRELAGPFPVDPAGEAALNHRFRLDPRWKTADLALASFVQNENTGDVLQALALPYCR